MRCDAMGIEAFLDMPTLVHMLLFSQLQSEHGYDVPAS